MSPVGDLLVGAIETGNRFRVGTWCERRNATMSRAQSPEEETEVDKPGEKRKEVSQLSCTIARFTKLGSRQLEVILMSIADGVGSLPRNPTCSD